MRKFLALLTFWVLIAVVLIGSILLPASAMGNRAGVYSCNLPQPNFGTIRNTENFREVYGLTADMATALYNSQGIEARYARDHWSHYYVSTFTAVAVNGFEMRYSIFFARLRDERHMLYVMVYRVSSQGIIYDDPCVTFVMERNYLENFLAYLRAS